MFTLQIFNMTPRAQNHVSGRFFIFGGFVSGFFVLFCLFGSCVSSLRFFLLGFGGGGGIKFPLWCAKWNLSTHGNIQRRICVYISVQHEPFPRRRLVVSVT